MPFYTNVNFIVFCWITNAAVAASAAVGEKH